MVDTAEFIPSVNVKSLIAAYEHISEQPVVPLQRQRARSLGNILSKNVVVRSNEFRTLKDIELALKQIEKDLNLYLIYDKEKHVSLQERLFNLLTCVINIESETEDHDPIRKKHLITKTQTLVSFLNQKLPSNATLHNNNNHNNKNNGFKYTTYSSFMENKNKLSKNNYQERVKDETSEDKEAAIVSVAKLKQNFQISSPKPAIHNESKVDSNKPQSKTKASAKLSSVDVEKQHDSESASSLEKTISVSKLRSLFEDSSNESNTGLEIIIKDPKKRIIGSNIPYIESNLTNHRYLRANSGNYMEYARLIRSTDINRSKSAYDLNKSNMMEFNIEKNQEAQLLDSDNSSDNESIESVREIKRELSSSVENLPENIVKSTVNKYENIISIADTVDGVSSKEEPIILAKDMLDNTSEGKYIDTNESDTDRCKDNEVNLEDADEIPVNIVRLTKQVYENAATEKSLDDLSFLHSKAENSTHNPNSIANDIKPLVSHVSEDDVSDKLDEEIEYVVEPDEIPENIVQKTVKAYERATLEATLELDDETTDRGENDFTNTDEDISCLTSQILDEDLLQPVHFENEDMQEEEIKYSSATTIDEDDIPENIVQKTVESYERATVDATLEDLCVGAKEKGENDFTNTEEDISCLTSQILDEDSSQYVHFENEDMQEEEIKYSSATTIDEDEIPENIVQKTVESYERATVDATLEDLCVGATEKALGSTAEEIQVTYSAPQVSDENSPQAIILENEDMQEEEIKYSTSIIVDEDEIPENIVQKTVESYEHAIQDATLEMDNESTGKEKDTTAEESEITYSTAEILDENSTTESNHFANDDIEEADIPYSNAIVYEDEIPREHVDETQPVIKYDSMEAPTTSLAEVDRNDIVDYAKSTASISEIDDIDLMSVVNPDDLKKAEEEFELLVVGD